MRINTQTSILSQLNETSKKRDKLFLQLSTMKRINSAKDNPSALAIANSLESSIRTLDSVNQGISMTQGVLETASGGLSQTMESLLRARDLAVQASNGTLSSEDRANLQTEYDQQIQNIDHIAQNTEFNGSSLLDGSFSTSIPTGSDVSSGQSLSIDSASSSALGINATGISTQADAQDAIEKIDAAIAEVNASQANIGASYNSLDFAASANSVQQENLAAAKSQIEDADLASLVSDLQAQNAKAEAQLAVLKKQNEDKKDFTKKLLGSG